jgi:hypothetical protein
MENRLSSPSTHPASECQPVFGSLAFGEPASRFTSAIERAGNWKKVREQVLEYGWMQLEETLQICKKARAAVGTTIPLVVRVWRNCTHFAYPVVYHANWTIRK